MEVSPKCQGQTLNIHGVKVPIDTVAGRYVDGHNVACLKSRYVPCRRSVLREICHAGRIREHSNDLVQEGLVLYAGVSGMGRVGFYSIRQCE